jgi:hypothetical protein
MTKGEGELPHGKIELANNPKRREEKRKKTREMDW